MGCPARDVVVIHAYLLLGVAHPPIFKPLQLQPLSSRQGCTGDAVGVGTTNAVRYVTTLLYLASRLCSWQVGSLADWQARREKKRLATHVTRIAESHDGGRGGRAIHATQASSSYMMAMYKATGGRPLCGTYLLVHTHLPHKYFIRNIAAHPRQDEPGLKRMPAQPPSPPPFSLIVGLAQSPNRTRSWLASWRAATETKPSRFASTSRHCLPAYQEFLVLISQVALKRKSNGKPGFLASIHSAGPSIISSLDLLFWYISAFTSTFRPTLVLSFVSACHQCVLKEPHRLYLGNARAAKNDISSRCLGLVWCAIYSRPSPHRLTAA